MTTLHWLPTDPTTRARTKALPTLPPADRWPEACAIAATQLDFLQTGSLDRVTRKAFPDGPPSDLATRPIRLAILSSSTTLHLPAGIRVAGLRRGLWIETYECDYAQYRQELQDPASNLHIFHPTAVLLALDPFHLAASVNASLDQPGADTAFDESLANIRDCWRMAREAFGAAIIQQTVLPLHPAILGSNEHRLPGSRHHFVTRLNAALRDAAATENAALLAPALLAIDDRIARDGLAAWHDPSLWHRAKQEISPAATPMYGDLVARILAAQQGRAFKCLVLDLDNTLWGGVIGDDGMDGIVIGQGNPLGEAYLALQDYAREQARRGIILAVCSKNDEANAVEPFEKHPDMLLRRTDIASFMANWNDKPSNIRAIAHSLSIGLDAMVFVDDNPFERALVRQELPMVAVPEIPEDPALVVPSLADAGYFEGLVVTPDDRKRASQYQTNIQREVLRAASGGVESYLQNLNMELHWSRFDRVGLQRIVQLINKTNQFNLTTRRYTEPEVTALIDDPSTFGLQFRLLDRFGDNGIIAIVIGRMPPQSSDATIDTWLMSCRVLGRQVEAATMAVVAQAARTVGATRIIGEYRPTAKNRMVQDHYPKLGFAPIDTIPGHYVLDLATYTPLKTSITLEPNLPIPSGA